MAKIIHNYEKCIGCGSCNAVCPEFWGMDYEAGKAILKGGKKNKKTGRSELEVNNAKDIERNQNAADICPVQAISIQKS